MTTGLGPCVLTLKASYEHQKQVHGKLTNLKFAKSRLPDVRGTPNPGCVFSKSHGPEQMIGSNRSD